MKKYFYHKGTFLLLGVVATGAVIMLTPLRFLDIVEPSIHEIAPVDFQKVFVVTPGNYIFIDVRPQEEYAAEHAAGSVNMPLETLYNQRHYLPKYGKTIVLICNGAQASGVAYGYLEHYGFLNLMRVTGGVPAWKAAGLPTVTGSVPSPAGVTLGAVPPLTIASTPVICS